MKMTNEKACTCPKCGTDISFNDKGVEYINPKQPNAIQRYTPQHTAEQHVVCESLIELEGSVNEQFSYLQGFMDAMNQKIDAMQIQIVKQAGEKKD